MTRINGFLSRMGWEPLVMVILFMAGILTLSYNINYYNKEREEYEKYLGKEYVLNNDTLYILDYSVIDESFILSNGQTINYKLIIEQSKD